MITSVCVFGDSVTRGVVFDGVCKKYVFLKDSVANLFQKITAIPVANYSRFGCTVTKGAQLLERHGGELGGFDCTVLEFGGNDCDFDWAEIARHPDGEHMPKTPLAQFEKAYSAMIGAVRARSSRPVMLTLPPLDSGRFFTWVSKGLDESRIMRWLEGDVNTIFRWHESYNRAVCTLAQRENVPLIDIRGAFLRRGNYKDLLCEDGMHPNETGHRVMLEAIRGALPHSQAVFA